MYNKSGLSSLITKGKNFRIKKYCVYIFKIPHGEKAVRKPKKIYKSCRRIPM